MNFLKNLNVKRNWILLAMTGGFGLTTFDNSIVSVALPFIQRDLNLSQEIMIWVFNAYILTFASTVLIAGRFGDLYGHVKMFQIGLILFLTSSTLCGLSLNGDILIFFRIFQGIGAALIQPASVAVILNYFAPHERGKALAFYSGLGVSFIAIGPIIGGILTSYLNWRWNFFISLPVGITTLIALYFLNPKTDRLLTKRLDKFGILLLIIAIPSLTLALKAIPLLGIVNPQTFILFAITLVLLILLVFHEKKHPTPIVNFKFFKNKYFCLYAICLSLTTFVLLSNNVFILLYLQTVFDYSPLKSAYYILYLIVPFILIGQIAGFFYDRFGIARLLPFGFFIGAIGTFMLSARLNAQTIELIPLSLILIGTGVGIIMSPTSTQLLNLATRRESGQISGLIQTIRLLGGTIGLSLFSGLVFKLKGIKILSLLNEYSISFSNKSLFERILSENSTEQLEHISALSSQVPSIIENLKILTASSIASGYLLSTCSLTIGFVISIYLLYFPEPKKK